MPQSNREHYNLLTAQFPHFPYMTYIFELRRQLADCDTILDVGCGDLSPIVYVNHGYTIGTDAYEPELKIAKTKKTHDEFVLCDARELDKHFKEDQYDACVALDLIEHLTEKEGLKLLKDMERIAKKKVIIFTPNGYIPQQSHDGDLQAHHSGWTPEQMEKLGYKVYGMYGHKVFRGEEHQIKIRPKAVGGMLAELTHYTYTKNRPAQAAAIFCVKDMTKA